MGPVLIMLMIMIMIMFLMIERGLVTNDYGDEVDPVGADDQFVFLMSICVFVFINIKMILKLLV